MGADYVYGVRCNMAWIQVVNERKSRRFEARWIAQKRRFLCAVGAGQRALPAASAPPRQQPAAAPRPAARSGLPRGGCLPQRRAWPEQLRRHHGALERQSVRRADHPRGRPHACSRPCSGLPEKPAIAGLKPRGTATRSVCGQAVLERQLGTIFLSGGGRTRQQQLPNGQSFQRSPRWAAPG